MTNRQERGSFTFVALSTMLLLSSLQAYSQPGDTPRAISDIRVFLDEINLDTSEYPGHEDTRSRTSFAVLPSSENYVPGKQSGKKRFYRIGGLCLMIAGTGAAVVYTLRAEEEVDKYSRSAFTKNTDRYRMNIKKYEFYRGIGLGFASAGFISFTVSFTL